MIAAFRVLRAASWPMLFLWAAPLNDCKVGKNARREGRPFYMAYQLDAPPPERPKSSLERASMTTQSVFEPPPSTPTSTSRVLGCARAMRMTQTGI